MKKIFYLLYVCVAAGQSTVAQDLIIKNDRTEIKSHMIEITETQVVFQRISESLPAKR
jgi:hypothetical protein